MIAKHAIAVRIYFAGAMTPFADLIMSDGVVETIQWTDVKEREAFAKTINGYTLIYDEREKREWKEWLAFAGRKKQERATKEDV